MDWNDYGTYFWHSPDHPWIWLIPIVYLYVLAYIIIKKARKAEILEVTRKYLYANALFMMFYGIARIMFLFSNYYYETYPNTYEEYSEFQIFIRLAYISGLIGLTNLLYGTETNFTKTKGRISLLPAITLIISIFMPYDIFRYMTYVVQFIAVFFIMSLYIYVAIKATGDIRKTGILSILGLILIITGVMFDSVAGKRTLTALNQRWIAYQLAPFVIMTGLYLLYRAWSKSFTNN